jgi:hypothetical protein
MMGPRNVTSLQVVAIVALLQFGCVRIYTASPGAIALGEPPSMKISRVITDLRMIGVALEAYAVDYNTYPVLNEKDLTVESFAMANIERLESHLKPYLKRVSPEDPWGRPYLYWSSGTSYALLSVGSDGVISDSNKFVDRMSISSSERVFVRATQTDCLEDEILFSAGQFLVMPKHSATECRQNRNQ